MTILRVALLQLSAEGADPAANLAKGLEACRRAREMGADIALFPEMWSVGYTFPAAPTEAATAEWAMLAEEPDGPFVSNFRQLARKLELAIAVTYLQRWAGLPRNTVTLIDCQGEPRLTYAKVHTCDFSRETALTPGEEFLVAEVETRAGPVKLGTMICYDREFPESARVLMLKGAEIILTPNACGLDEGRIGQFRARAFENMVGVAMANYPRPQCNGRSCAFDAVNYAVPDGPERDTTIVLAGDEEGIVLAEFDLERLRAYRERETWGHAYRKPRAYGLLTDQRVEPPFVRGDARR
jgi:predicted amidohydrolase